MTRATKKTEVASTEKKSSSRAVTPKVIKKVAKKTKSVVKHRAVTAKGGRPSLYSDVLINRICQRIAEGESLRSICNDKEMPGRQTVLDWLDDASNTGFRAKYARAREEQADLYAAEIIEIADDSSGDVVQTENGPKLDSEFAARSRLRIDARKWYASKLAPKKYGDKLAIEAEIAQLTPDQVAARLAVLMAKNGTQ